MHYLNEWDPFAARWLRELIGAGHLPRGTVDERDIRDVTPEDLVGYDQCHWFGGIGGWPLALRLAGWPDERPCWTASCPCQPFSAAGKGGGEEDPRHLWPALSALVRECRPDCVFGEQVAGRAGYGWLDGVRADLEAEGYAFGAADLPACCQGAPHVRSRLFWVAHLQGERASSGQGRVADADGDGRDGEGLHLPQRGPRAAVPDAAGAGAAGFWDGSALLPCADGKARRTQPGLQPLVDGLPFLLADGRAREDVSRAKVLQGIGNAIVPAVGALFVKAFLETEGVGE